ncbi:MAG: CoA transferase [Chloroflexi bacterium]|nr:CoA transferase [Chloroflexota bacterium]
MEQAQASEALLEGYRGLDLTDERGLLCGRILADLGAEVVKVERPRGDPARNIGPFYQDIPHPERSLFWLAYNVNKKGITLDIQTRDGQELFLRLVTKFDFVLESYSTGYLEGLGLGYSRLKEINPGLVFTSITPFGGSGPYRDHKATDITLMAMGGYMYMTGEPDRPPLRISCDQAYLHAASEAAVATLVALYQRGSSGQGQHIDVSARASLIASTANAVPFWEMNRVILKRAGPYRAGLTSAKQRQLWECRDGCVIFYFAGGAFGAKGNTALAAWLDSEGLADDFVRSMNWEEFDMATATEEVEDHLEALVSSLFRRYKAGELYEQAMSRGLTLCPVLTPGEIVQNQQLKARGYWVKVRHDDLDESFSYPGPFAKSSAMSFRYRRAPRIGEHNREVYQDELGLSSQQLVALKQAGAI